MKQKQAGTKSSVVKRVAVGVGISIITTLIICVAFAAMIGSQIMDPSYMGYGAAVALLLGGIVGSWSAIGKWTGSSLLVCSLTGLTYILCLLCCGIALFDGKFQNVLVTVLLVAGSTIAPTLLRLKKHNKKGPGRIRYKIS